MDGQGAQILQQVGDLLSQLAQQETEPSLQRGILRVMKELEPMMNLVANDDQQDMTSGLNTPGGPPGPDQGGAPPGPGGGPPPDQAGALGGGPGGPGQPPGGPPPIGGPPDMGSTISSEGIGNLGQGATESGPPPRDFKGANKAALANLREKGSFSRSGSKETERAKNRREGGKSLSQGRK